MRTIFGVAWNWLILGGNVLIYASYFPVNDTVDARIFAYMPAPVTFQPLRPGDWVDEKNICFESVAKMEYGDQGKELVMINQDIQPSAAIADRMSYWLLAALMTFGLLGAVLLPVAVLVFY